MSRPSAWATVWRNFVDSFKKSKKLERHYVGEDQFGNRFYEYTHESHTSNVKRGIDASADAPKPPPEWEMWLKNSRKHPPTEDEIQYTQLRQQQMQAILQKQDAETERRAPKVASEGRGAADVDRGTQFPSYSDIELTPGASAEHGTYAKKPQKSEDQPKRASSHKADLKKPIDERKRSDSVKNKK